MALVRRQIPILITALVGLIIVYEYFFVVSDYVSTTVNELKIFGTIIASFALFLGVVSSFRNNLHHFQRRTKDRWYFALWTIIVTIVSTAIGLIGSPNHPAYQWIFTNVLRTLWTTMVSTTGFFIASAAFRAFRVRTIDSALLLVAGLLITIRNTPVLVSYWGGFTSIGNWVMDVAASGAIRGIILGAAIGSIAIGLRTILGYERGYLGKTGEE